MPQRSIATAEDEVETESLSGNEKQRLQGVYERLLEDTRTQGSNVFVQKLMEYQNEIEFGASVAKAQFQQNLGGGSTTTGQFAVSHIDPGFFGWDQWDNAPDAAADTTNTWLDSSNPDNLAGTGGEPLIIGEDAVHVVVGIGTYEQSPKENKYKFEVNREPKTVVRVEDAWRETDLQVKWLDSAYVFNEDTEVFAERYSPIAGASSPRLIGVSFVEGKAARRINPDNYTGTQTANNIVVEQ